MNSAASGKGAAIGVRKRHRVSFSRGYLAAFLVFLVFLPTAFGTVQRWAWGLTGAAVFAAASGALLCSLRRKSIRLRSYEAAAGLGILFFASSGFLSGLPGPFIEECLRVSAILALFLLTARNALPAKASRLSVGALISIATALSLYGLIQRGGGLPHPWWYQANQLSATFVNHNHFAAYLEITIPLTAALFLVQKKNPRRALLAYCLLVQGVALFLSLSRGGWLGAGAGGAAFLLLLKPWKRGRPWRRPILMMGMVVALLVLLALFIPSVRFRISGISEDPGSSFYARVLIWSSTMQIIRNHPFLGVGPGNFRWFFPSVRPPGLANQVNFAHNDYLQLLAEQGLLGLAAWGLFVFLVVRTVAKAGVLDGRGLSVIRLGAWTAGISLAVHALVDFPFHIGATAFTVAFLAGSVVGDQPVDGAKGNREARLFISRRERCFLGWISAAAAAISLSAAAGDICGGVGRRAFRSVDMERAARWYLRAERLAPWVHAYPAERAKALLVPTRFAFGKRAASEARQAVERAERRNPRDGDVLLLKGHILETDGDIRGADTAFHGAVALDPGNVFYRRQYGMFLDRYGHTREALKQFREADLGMRGDPFLKRKIAELERKSEGMRKAHAEE